MVILKTIFVKLLNKFDFDLKFIFDNIKLNIIQK